MFETLVEIVEHLRARLAAGDDAVTLTVGDPDLGRGRFAGETIEHDGRTFVHRPLRVWVELADRLALRLATPRPAGPGCVQLRFERLEPEQKIATDDPTEKYGGHTAYARVHKLEDPGFVLDMTDALERACLPPCPRVLDLGCNDAEVLTFIARHRPGATFVGVDHSASALAIARRRFPGDDHHFLEADLHAVPELDLGRFDLVLTLCTLQSPGVDHDAIVRHIVQDRLTHDGCVIVAVPNCRYRDGEVLYGARMKNFTQPDLSLVVKTVAHYRRYLQQHRFKVWITGRNYILVTGVPTSARRAG